METREDRDLRRSNQEVGQVLDVLDEGAEGVRLRNLRGSERYAYRAKKLVVEIVQPDGQRTRYAAASRNISSGGASLILGQFVYPGSTCNVQLVSVHNYWQKVPGKIVRCRYIAGSRNLHEVGVSFDRRVDVTMFHRAASTVRLLLVDSEPANEKLLERLLRGLNVRVTRTTDAAQIRKLANNSTFDLAMIDLDCDGVEPAKLLGELREAGFLRPILATSAAMDPNIRTQSLEQGFSEFIARPTDEATLTKCFEALLDEPMISTLVHDSHMTELIDAFVATLAGAVSGLEAAYGRKDATELVKLVRRLKGQAGSYGFEVITDAATKLEAVLSDQPDWGEVRTRLNQLIRWCLAARPVSCAEQRRPGGPSKDDDALA